MWRGLQTLYAIVPGAIVSRFGGFLAYYCSKEREIASIGSFWYHQQIVSKHSTQVSVSWCYRVILVDTRFIRRVVLTVKNGFSTLLQRVGRISQKWYGRYF